MKFFLWNYNCLVSCFGIANTSESRLREFNRISENFLKRQKNSRIPNFITKIIKYVKYFTRNPKRISAVFHEYQGTLNGTTHSNVVLNRIKYSTKFVFTKSSIIWRCKRKNCIQTSEILSKIEKIV